jgi:hypothetical protein
MDIMRETIVVQDSLWEEDQFQADTVKSHSHKIKISEWYCSDVYKLYNSTVIYTICYIQNSHNNNKEYSYIIVRMFSHNSNTYF